MTFNPISSRSLISHILLSGAIPALASGGAAKSVEKILLQDSLDGSKLLQSRLLVKTDSAGGIIPKEGDTVYTPMVYTIFDLDADIDDLEVGDMSDESTGLSKVLLKHI